jgi:hypothetical protein
MRISCMFLTVAAIDDRAARRLRMQRLARRTASLRLAS